MGHRYRNVPAYQATFGGGHYQRPYWSWGWWYPLVSQRSDDVECHEWSSEVVSHTNVGLWSPGWLEWGSRACRDGLWYAYSICVPVSCRGCRSVLPACSWQDCSGCPSWILGRSRPVPKTLVVRPWPLINGRSQWWLAWVLSRGSSTIWQVFHQGRWTWRVCTIHWSQVLNQEWRCSWSSADRRCSNYIWVIKKNIAC